jgi:hypothetical protein
MVLDPATKTTNKNKPKNKDTMYDFKVAFETRNDALHHSITTTLNNYITA